MLLQVPSCDSMRSLVLAISRQLNARGVVNVASACYLWNPSTQLLRFRGLRHVFIRFFSDRIGAGQFKVSLRGRTAPAYADILTLR